MSTYQLLAGSAFCAAFYRNSCHRELVYEALQTLRQEAVGARYTGNAQAARPKTWGVA